MRNFKGWAIALFFVALLFSPEGYAAPSPKFIGKNEGWQAFQNGKGMSFAVAEPLHQKGTFAKRGKPHVLVNCPRGKKAETVSIVAGYVYQPQSEVIVNIGAATFSLFTVGDTAWARDEETDKQLIANMCAGKEMIVSGTSSRGNVIRDTYTLKGFSRTYTLAKEAVKKG